MMMDERMAWAIEAVGRHMIPFLQHMQMNTE
jgi:hypothetical protein